LKILEEKDIFYHLLNRITKKIYLALITSTKSNDNPSRIIVTFWFNHFYAIIFVPSTTGNEEMVNHCIIERYRRF